MPVLTPEEITNLYLYGTKSRPGDLLDERLIRASAEEIQAAKAEASTEVDINDYMAEVGRFTSPADFEIINKFFASDDLPVGSYNEQDMRDLLDVDEKWIVQKQWAFSDDTEDYAARVYIWNSTAFEIDDHVRFIVEKDGSRRIENFAITPLNHGPDNFDFKSEDTLARLGNGYLEEIVDPSGIGRKVIINFTGDRTLTTLDAEGYRQAVASKPSASLTPKLSLLSEIQRLTDELFASGSTRALFDNKPIFYGSRQSDVMTGYDAKNEDLDDHRHLENYADNGVVYVGEQETTPSKEPVMMTFLLADRMTISCKAGPETTFISWMTAIPFSIQIIKAIFTSTTDSSPAVPARKAMPRIPIPVTATNMCWTAVR